MPSSYRQSNRDSSNANLVDSEDDNTPHHRRPVGKTSAVKVGSSTRRKKTLIEELGGQQVITTTESTSYGSGTAVRPIQIKRTIEGDDLASQMKHIIGGSSVPPNPLQRVPGETHKLHPGKASTRAPSVSTLPATNIRSTPAKAAPAKKPAKSTVRRSPAFDEASDAVDHATFTKDQATPVPRKKTATQPALSRVPEEDSVPMPPPVKPSRLPKAKTAPRPATSSRKTNITKNIVAWGDLAKQSFSHLWRKLKEYQTWLCFFLLMAIILRTAISSDDGAYHYHTALNTIRSHTPDALARPLYWLNEKSLRDLNGRVAVLEVDVDQLKLDGERNQAAIAGLTKQLPEFVVAKKDKKGELELPTDFWHAIKNKIASEDAMKPAGVQWNNFWLTNEQRVKKIAADEVRVSRAEIEKIIRRDVDGVKQNVKLANHLSSSKIEALIVNKIREQNSQKLRAYNHFDKKQGAIPLPDNTDPTYTPNHYKGVGLAGKALRFGLKFANIKAPVPFGPEVALMPWEEAGQCWCANSKAHGVQLGVRTKEQFYPTEVIVEHINPEATLDKGSAPKDMELFVKVPLDKQDEIAFASTNMFPDAEEDTILDHEWVRIARWTYDVKANESMQVFGLQVDPKRYEVSANEFVIRARNNWGEPPADHTCFYRVRVHGKIPEFKGFTQFAV